MTLDAQLWREVGRHLELEALLKRLAPMVRGLLPVDALFVRRLERNPTRLMTVASGACEPGHAPEPRGQSIALSSTPDVLSQTDG